MDAGRKLKWFGVAVQFAFGCGIGGLGGAYAWARSHWAMSTSWWPGLLFIGGGALVGGLLAGVFQQAFWESFRDNPWSWW